MTAVEFFAIIGIFTFIILGGYIFFNILFDVAEIIQKYVKKTIYRKAERISYTEFAEIYDRTRNMEIRISNLENKRRR